MRLNSFVFRNFDVEADSSKDLIRDVQSLLDVPTEQIPHYISFVQRLVQKRTSREQSELLDEFLDETSEPSYRVQGVIRLSRYLVGMQSNKKCPRDDWKHWASDLEQLGLISGTERESAHRFFEAFSDRLESMQEEKRRQDSELGVLPILSSVGATAEIRPILEKDFHPGDDLESYKPGIIGFSAVASLTIGFDAGFPSSCNFQVTKSSLRLLIERLQATEKELDTIEGWVKGNKQ